MANLPSKQAGGTARATTLPVDPEVSAVKKLVKLLEKSAKSSRTYGSTNPLARKFVLQFYEELTSYLTIHHTVGLFVLRSELYFGGEPVYQTDQETENLAFKLYADGIRELVFHEGLSEADLAFFLETLAGNPDAVLSDDDIVIRLWEKDLTTITCVTAEESLQASAFARVLAVRESGTLNRPLSGLREVHAAERTREQQSAGAETEKKSGARAQDSLVGYEVSAREMAALAREIEAESTRDNTLYILDMFTAILSGERSGHLLSKLFDILPEVLDTLTQESNWTGLNAIAGQLQDVEGIRLDLTEGHRKQLANLRETLYHPTRIKNIEAFLNNAPGASTAGLLEFFLLLGKPVVSPLCLILGNLESPSHRALVCKTLNGLAKEYPDPLVRALADPRDSSVMDILSVVWNLHDPRFIEPCSKLVRHRSGPVRKKVLRLLDMLQGTGSGAWLVRFLEDSDDSIRHLALQTLSAGEYTTRFSDWASIVSNRAFLDRPAVEKRGIFDAMRHTSGDESVAYWEQLVTKWFWINRRKREEIGTLAAAALAKLGTPSAISALRAGLRRRNRPIRQACSVALEATR